MTGQRYIEIVDPIRKQKGWSKGEFCRRIGVSPNMYGNYRNGTVPSYAVIEATEKCLGIRFSDYEKSEMDDETAEVLQWIREDYSYRALFESAKSLTKEQRLTAAAYIERLKAGDT